MSAEPHLVANRYRLDERIGSGGMGVVWRAHDVVLNRTVAVKQLLLLPGLSPGEADESRARAMREGRIAARLQHPQAINVFDVALGPDLEGGKDSQPWLVMEYLPSRSLADVLSEQGALPPLEVARIGRQIADALAAAHRAGIVHRDVKPGNVLIGENGTVKITDFGIARASWDPTVTRTGVLTGTPAYFSPEVARGEAPGPASDVFSLGSTLYTAVEGAPPFGHDDNTLALLRSVAEARVRPPQNAGPLSALLMQLLRDDPTQRPLMTVARDMLGRVASTGLAPAEAALLAADGDPGEALPGSDPASAPLPEGATGVSGGAASVGVVAAGIPAAAGPPRSEVLEPAALQPASLERAPLPAEPDPPAQPAQPAQPARPASRVGKPPWWQRARVLTGALVLLLVAIGAVVLVTALGEPDVASTDADAPSSSNAPITTTTAAPTTEPSTTTPAPTTAAPPPPPPAEPGAAEFTQAVQTYYGLLPEQLDEAYLYLGPDVQEQAGGPSGYENFWTRFSDVGTENVQADGTTVTLTIIYTNPDGSTFTEPYVLQMGTAEDGRILILSSEIGGPG